MSKIEWTDITINPVVGCSKCSVACQNCYAERFASRLAKNPQTQAKYAGVVDDKGNWTGKLNFEGWGCIDTLPQSPRRVFLGSMTDTFHENMKLSDFQGLADYMEFTWPQHTFMLLTKRPARAAEFISKRPLPKNVWLGVTVCNQKEADIKIPILLGIAATVRFISVEPMLGPVNLWRYFPLGSCLMPAQVSLGIERVRINPEYENGLHWVICGGETGKGARPMDPEWARSLSNQCQKAGVPFFFKKLADRAPIPHDLQIRQFPEA